jgi:putative ubiquitin-RnfH superfamily antitoxin RatB of RatAB toxin-antitoxin module
MSGAEQTSESDLAIEVAYALPERQVLIALTVPRGTTLGGAIERSGLLAQFPEIALAKNAVGVFGKLRALTDALENGDRVEVYRPLIADPKVVRRQRAAKK